MLRSRSGLLVIAGLALSFSAYGIAMAQGTAPSNGGEEQYWASLIRTLSEGIITVLIAWAAKKFSEKTGIDIEATHRNALHSAAMTGINAALAKVPPVGRKVPARDPMVVREAFDWVVKSVPDALKYLGVDPTTPEGREKLANLVESKLGALLNTPAPTATAVAAATREVGRIGG
ncbi:MAG TPA: hypothetical protein VFY92_04940 [Hyphomicrobiaceae bacterium]|nr:hypothetical protein [Hyphomicrobiaceae bacterium]